MIQYHKSWTIPAPATAVKLLPGFLIALTTVFACGFGCGDARAGAVPTIPSATPKIQLVVSLARGTIRESDQIPVIVAVSNDSDTDLTTVSLRLSTPDDSHELHWHQDSCAGTAAQEDMSLGALAAHSVTFKTLCLTSDATIGTGSLNLLFTSVFKWKSGDTFEESFVSVEKPLTFQLLGTDSLAGIPLGIAGLVVPGLLFGILATACGAKWGPGVALGERLIYSILVSAAILAALSHFSYFSLKAGMSLKKLILLAGIGACAGLIAGGIDALIRRVRQAKVDARTVRLGDDETTALGKLLHLYDGKNIRKTTLRAKNGEQFVGALGEQRVDLVMLVGWFEVEKGGGNDADFSAVQQLFKVRKYAELFDTAKQKRFALKPVNAIQTFRSTDGQLITTGVFVRFWKPDDVQEVVPVTGELEKGERPALSCP